MGTGPAFAVRLKRSAIFVHRWLGVALCVVFLLWFPSGIGMMYWDLPDVSGRRSARAIACARCIEGAPLAGTGVRHDRRRTSADSGPSQLVRRPSCVPLRRRSHRLRRHGRRANRRLARVDAARRGGVDRPAGERRAGRIGRRKSISGRWAAPFVIGRCGNTRGRTASRSTCPERSGDVVQYTTTGSRLGAYVGAIPHWLYFTPLRKHGPEWSRVVIWSSGGAHSPRSSAS